MEAITLARPSFDDDALAALNDVLKSGNLVQGEQVEAFERRICEYTEAQFAVAMNSATSGLFASLLSCGVEPGDEVIVPALSYIATANVVEVLGATPIFCDISSHGFNIDCAELEAKLSRKTKAVIGVHEFGEPLNIEFLLDFCGENNLCLIEDAACALGTRYKEKHVGVFGKTGVFSFHPRKSITCGDGGVVTTNDPDLARRLRSIRNHGLENYGGANSGFHMTGLNFRLTEIQAVLLNSQLPKLDGFLERKYKHVLTYDENLTGGLEKPDPKLEGHSWQSYHVLCGNTALRNTLIETLRKKSVYVSLGAQCLPCEPFFKNKYGYGESDFPNAHRANTRGLVLPIHENLTEEDVVKVINSVNKEI